MPYTLKFSDPSKSSTVIVPDMPPGINTVDTSLNLVGRGYPNYGEKTAENFLHLLENFAGPFPGPNNPIEGQLWYDTTDPNHKVLRVRDGINWVSANGIYQQSTDPKVDPETATRVKAGDIWVDTSNYELSVFNNNSWTKIGPMKTAVNDTGVEVETIMSTVDIPNVTQGHPVIKVWAEGDVVAVITSRKFTPKSVIPGFTDLVPGINLRATEFVAGDPKPILNGTAKIAQGLEIGGVRVSSNSILRKEDNTYRAQVITGQVFFKEPTDVLDDAGFGQGKYGIVINNESSTLDSKYVQFYKGEHDAIVLNNDPAGSIVLKVNDGSATLVDALTVDASGLAITVPVTLNDTVALQGDVTTVGSLSVGTTATVGSSLIVNGPTTINNNMTLTGQLVVSTATAIIPDQPGVYNIGSPSRYFNQLYVTEIGSTSTATVVYGKVVGTASALEYGTEFKLEGQVTATSFIFSGTATTATFNASLTPTAISDQTTATTASNLTFLALNTVSNALEKIAYPEIVSPIVMPGMITAYGSGTPPTGWLLCDGAEVDQTTYANLYSVVGLAYGAAAPGKFKVPNYTSTAVGGYTIYYIIKY